MNVLKVFKPYLTHEMASHLKGVTKSTMSYQIRKELCEYKRDNPASTQLYDTIQKYNTSAIGCNKKR